MKTYKIFSVIVIVYHCFFAKSLAAQNAVFINNCKSYEDIHFSYVNQFDDVTTYGQMIFNNGGTIGHMFNVEVSPKTIVNFTKEFFVYPVYVNPGDTINVFCSLNTNGYDYFFKTNAKAVETNILVEIEKKFGFSFNQMSNLTLTNRTNFLLLMEEKEKEFEAKRAYVDNALYQNLITKQLHEDILFELNFKKLLEELTPFSHRPPGLDLKKISGDYVKALDKVRPLISSHSLLTNVSYRNFLLAYNYFLCKDSLGMGNDFDVLYRQATTSFSGRSRDYLQMKLLITYMKSGTSGLEKTSSAFVMNCSDPEYHAYYTGFLKELTPSFDEMEALITLDGNSIGWKQILSQTGSKIIYIDFWASWCGPCLQEMSFTKKLQEYYKGKDVSFVFISVDDQETKWKSAVLKLPIEFLPKNHFLTNDKSPLAKAFHVPPIPRYVIVKSNGEVIASDAAKQCQPD